MDQKLDQFFLNAQTTIDNALSNIAIQDYLSAFGYTVDRIQVGKNLYEEAMSAQQHQIAERGERVAATADLNAVWSTARKSYIRLVKLARIAFKDDPGIATKLALKGRRKQNLSGWLLQAKQFYANALSDTDIYEGLAAYGITLAHLQASQAEVQAVEAANNIQEQEKGRAQAATQARNAAVAALSDWLSDFRGVAKIALEEEAQLLEILGIRRY